MSGVRSCLSGPRAYQSGERLAWLDQPAKGKFLIQTPDGKQARTVTAPAGKVGAMTMAGDRIVFVERELDESWRFASVPWCSANQIP